MSPEIRPHGQNDLVAGLRQGQLRLGAAQGGARGPGPTYRSERVLPGAALMRSQQGLDRNAMGTEGTICAHAMCVQCIMPPAFQIVKMLRYT